MKSHSIFDPLDSSTDPGVGGSDIDFGPILNFGPLLAGPLGGTANSPPASTPVAPVIPDESVEAMAAVSSSGAGGPGSVVAETSSSGFTINLIFDSAAMAAPASFRAGIEQAAAILSATITNKITVNLNIDYKGTGGGAAAGPDNGEFINYSTVRSDLIANAAPGDTSFNALPTGSTIGGQSSVAVWNAQLKLFGLLSPNSTTTDDGSATFATDINPSLLVGVALHELTHALGRVPYGSQPDIFDFYRFTSPGTYLFQSGNTAPAAYFSLDGGNTKLADFGLYSDPSDFLNPANGALPGPYSNLTPNDPFNELYGSGTLQSLTSVDLKMLDALGFNTMPLGLAVVATSAEALQGGAAVALLSTAPAINDPGSTTLAGATIKIANASGNAVAGDELFVNTGSGNVQNGSLGNGVTASWNPTTDTLTLSGTASTAIYDTLLSEITFQDTGTDTSSGSHPVRIVTWAVNDGTNSYTTTSTIEVDRAPVVANTTATDVVGTKLSTTAVHGVLANASDLDSDSLTVLAVSDALHGAGTVGSSLAGAYGHLTLNANGSYSYVADNATAIASGATGSHLQDVFGYTVSDGNGGTTTASLTITLDRAPVVTAANVTLDATHAVAVSSLFSATDPDGNAITTYAFENTGSGHFVLGSTIEPSNQEIDVSAAQLLQLTYQSVAGTTPDTVEVRVNDGTLWSNWTTFTATPGQVIEAHGVTSLVEIGNAYYVEPVAGGTSTELMYNGAPLTVGEFGSSVAPIAAEAIAGGYEVAWHNAAANAYTVWNFDSNGVFVSDTIGTVSATSTALESLEPSFQQDLNGDGVIGINIPSTVIEAHGVTSLVEVSNNYFMNPVAGETGPELKYNGAPVTAGEFGPWTLIAAEAISTGYEVAFKDATDNAYLVWDTDSNGNYVSAPIGEVSATSTALESLEPSFQQDLNGDGVIGINAPPVPTGTVIEAHGATSLVEIGNAYYVEPVAGGTATELMYGGAALTAGEFGSAVAPIAAEATAAGYEVAWHNAAANAYTVWNFDSNGNFVNDTIGTVAPTSAALESLEPSFQQDLNGDGVIGLNIPTTVIEAHGVTSLVEVGNNYFMNPVAGGTGPELKYNGAAVTTGEFGPWTPIAAEATSTGYEVAFKDAPDNAYLIWDTDSNGNYVSAPIGEVSATSTALESLEPSFQQDLNGDGVIGIPTTTQPLVAANNVATANLQSVTGSSTVPSTSASATETVTLSSGATVPDNFVFAPNFGQATVANFIPASDTIQIDHTMFASVSELLAATHDDVNGSAVITDLQHDTITIKGVSTAQLLAHQTDFHFV